MGKRVLKQRNKARRRARRRAQINLAIVGKVKDSLSPLTGRLLLLWLGFDRMSGGLRDAKP